MVLKKKKKRCDKPRVLEVADSVQMKKQPNMSKNSQVKRKSAIFPMKRRSIPTGVVLFMFMFLNVEGKKPANPTLSGYQKNCSYIIEVETTCAPGAETRDRVRIRFSDSEGHMIIVKDLKNRKLNGPKRGVKKQGSINGGFERCAIDMYQASGPCMSHLICSLYLKKVGSDGWRPGWVRVLLDGGAAGLVPTSYKFYFRTFLPENVWYGFNYCNSFSDLMPHVTVFGGN